MKTLILICSMALQGHACNIDTARKAFEMSGCNYHVAEQALLFNPELQVRQGEESHIRCEGRT